MPKHIDATSLPTSVTANANTRVNMMYTYPEIGGLYKTRSCLITLLADGETETYAAAHYINRGEVVMILQIEPLAAWTFKILHRENILYVQHTTHYILEAFSDGRIDSPLSHT